MSKLIVVPEYRHRIRGPLIFLAGPIQGAPDWQADAIREIHSTDPKLTVATPRSPPPWHGDFDGQVDWEHWHLNRACKNGVVLFWLAKEASHDCHRAYAQTTRFELGWHFALARLKKAMIVIGIEPGFSNERYLRRTFRKLAPKVPVYDSLIDTVRIAVSFARDPPR